MLYLSHALMHVAALVCGTYLCMHEHPTIGGWLCVLGVLSICCTEYKRTR